MQTDFTAEQRLNPKIARADEILRSCVHCGFCNATCPTYQLTGDELDGPRGRIYLMREFLTDAGNTVRTTQHLDRCLTCRACETTCPSGVAYGELAEIAREQMGPDRQGYAGIIRRILAWVVPRPDRLRFVLRLAKPFSWLLPAPITKNIPATVGSSFVVSTHKHRKILLLNGCVQQVNTPLTNRHLTTLLEKRGVGVVTEAQEVCCGALDLHLGDNRAALKFARENIDRLYPHLDSVEAIISTASGCGVTVKDYERLFVDDPLYARRAAAVAAKTLDVSEFLGQSGFEFSASKVDKKVAWHAPCTLQHGQQLGAHVEKILADAGYVLTFVADPHLCCGSAGTYSILQARMADQLRDQKLNALLAGDPELVATANVGCQSHLSAGSGVPVHHWIELLE
jgi:glycolate oxidase iron-sulfur subunit